MLKKILIVINVDWFFISHRLPIALAAKENGYEIHIATGLTDRLDILQSYGFIVHPLNIDRSSTGIKNTISTFLEIWRAYKLIRPNLVHLVTIKPVILGGIAARLAGVPAVVAAVSGLGFVFVAQGAKAALRRGFVGLLYRIALGHPNLRVIFQNDNDKTSLVNLARISEEKTSMIRGSGVDLSQYIVVPHPQGNPVVLMAARLLLDKGVREFVQAARLLRQRHDNFGKKARFILVGDLDPANPTSLTALELQQWVEEGLVEHWGHRTDMPVVLSAANIVVLPSYYGEGLPKVLIEAAACGRAVVTTDHPGCRDAIEAGNSGVLVPVRDAKALAQAIQALLDDSERCVTMGLAGRKLAERAFDVRQVVAEHLRIYDELQTRIVR